MTSVKTQPSMWQVLPHIWNIKNLRPAPNPILRGNLFGLVPRGSEEVLSNLQVYEDKRLNIQYDGVALGQCDLDVWLRIIQIAGQKFMDSHAKTITIDINPGEFLKEIGRTGGKCGHLGKNDREWLVKSLKRLTGLITLKTPDDKKGIIGGLIKGVAWNDEQNKLLIEIDNTIGYLFSSQYSLINTEARKLLMGDDLSLWLHAFIAAHKGRGEKFFYSVETLKIRCRSRISENRKFKYAVTKKMEKLMGLSQELRGFAEWGWENDVLHVFFQKIPHQLNLV